MKKTEVLDLIFKLSNARGASGFEEEVAELVAQATAPYGESVQDKMNNCYLWRSVDSPHAKQLRVQLDAHLDEVSFIVQQLKNNGTLGALPLGGWVASNISAHKYWLRLTDGSYTTAISANKPPHFMSEKERLSSQDSSNLTLDIGARSKAEALARGAGMGEPCVPAVTCEYNEQEDLLIGKAFDCRAGCTALIETLDMLQNEKLDCEVVAGFSTQEEVGTRGAKVTAQQIQPDLAIVFEGCPADDTFLSEEDSQTRLKEGPMLRYLDRSMITHPRFQRYALEIARKEGIKVQTAVRSGGSTNGAAIHLTEQAVPCIVIGIPVRYIHTHYGITSYFDIHESARLAAAILRSLSREVYDCI